MIAIHPPEWKTRGIDAVAQNAHMSRAREQEFFINAFLWHRPGQIDFT